MKCTNCKKVFKSEKVLFMLRWPRNSNISLDGDLAKNVLDLLNSDLMHSLTCDNCSSILIDKYFARLLIEISESFRQVHFLSAYQSDLWFGKIILISRSNKPTKQLFDLRSFIDNASVNYLQLIFS